MDIGDPHALRDLVQRYPCQVRLQRHCLCSEGWMAFTAQRHPQRGVILTSGVSFTAMTPREDVTLIGLYRISHLASCISHLHPTCSRILILTYDAS